MKINCLIWVLGFFAFTAVEGLAQPFHNAEAPLLSCSDPGTEYYTIELVTTKKIPGTGQAKGKAIMSFEKSPFGISISKDGTFVHKLSIQITNLPEPQDASYVAWVTTPNLDKIKMLGVLDGNLKASGTVEWNKYLVVITKESSSQNIGGMWQGPIVMRGMSKSGYMHTMAGHGPFTRDPCAKYGY
ncbi:MAG: hypothetical protein U5J95_07090 [Balneolaceae bacterium]|nr:hypothetical protein [Balneolaceae bacterium]